MLEPLSALKQLALDLPNPEQSGLEDFLPSPSNEAALHAVLQWPDWPSHCLIIDGAPGCGKTHLARIWQKKTGAGWYSGTRSSLKEHVLETRISYLHLVIDDVDQFDNETTLLQLYNSVLEKKGYLLLCANSPLGAWLPVLPDLASRLRAAWSIHIGAAQDELLKAVLVKQFSDRQLSIEPEVINYIVSRMERSFAAARQIVYAMDRLSLNARKPLNLYLAQRVMNWLDDKNSLS